MFETKFLLYSKNFSDAMESLTRYISALKKITIYCKQNCIHYYLTEIYCEKHFYSFFPSHTMDSQNEWSREFDRNIKLISGLVSDGTSVLTMWYT